MISCLFLTVVTFASVLSPRQDAQGATALHWACKWGHKAVVRLLIAHGVRQDTRDKEGRLASEILERTQLVRPDSHCEVRGMPQRPLWTIRIIHKGLLFLGG